MFRRRQQLLPPKPLEPQRLGRYSCGEEYSFTGEDGNHYGVYKFDVTTKMPTIIARWLRHWSHVDDSVGTYHEGDKYRFNKVSTIRRRFLKDQGGRILVAAVDQETGNLGGVAWTHELKGNIKDYTLYLAGLGRLAGEEAYTSHLLTPQEFGTVAVREYGEARHAVAAHLIASATALHFEAHPDHLGVVGRFSKNDSLIQDLHDDQANHVGDHAYQPISSGPGYIIMFAMNTQPPGAEGCNS